MKIPTTDTSERGFQKLFVRELVDKQGYTETNAKDFNTEFCINEKELLSFLEVTQKKFYDYIHKTGLRAFFVRLDKHIKDKGIIDLFRKGISHKNRKAWLFYAKPNSIFNQDTITLYQANRFSVTQELVYSHSPSNNNRLDLTVFLNGFPIVTMELKNAYTYQSVTNAITQYKKDRDPRDKIFNFGRCMVHFAVDTSQVFMTTTLAKFGTKFFPFNKGLNDGAGREPFGAGNPLHPNGQKTAYLYEDILTKDSIANLIEKFVVIIEEKDNNTKKTHKIQFFPRYHQLMVVRKLLDDCKDNGVGGRYLIQHSAGSGKSNSITWLALQLTSLYNREGVSPLFDSVLVVTDRQNLDAQIRTNIKNFAQKKGIVEAITGKSKDIRVLNPNEDSTSKTIHMRLALTNNKKIIICTVQTFPHVLKAISESEAKKVAIIIDEAHSSQSGSAAASMNALFSDAQFEDIERDEEGNVSTEDLLNYLIESKKMLSNASYFAFTATPKNKTLETFGTPVSYKDEHGENKERFEPFHNYSMKQAIEEQFIHDVLKNYTTYESWYKVRQNKKAEGEEEESFETQEANKKMRKYVEGHKIAIRDKSRIMIDHFRKNVWKKINKEAKAMVVCRSIESAIKYKDAFDAYLKELQSPYKSIIAFSGKKKHYETGKELTEEKMNQFADGSNDIPKQFKKREYRFLIVANKFQTGFDEPLLHTMYVDKLLANVQAVQTLSRLNRAKKNKTETFVLDFYNKVEDIKEAFAPFYTTTILSEETDINKLHDLQDDLDAYELYDEAILDEFFNGFYNKVDSDILNGMSQKVGHAFEQDLIKDLQIDFKSKVKSFYRTYNYLVKLMEAGEANHYWEKLALFLKYLLPHLKIKEDLIEENILEVIEMDSYRTVLIQDKQNILLEPEIGYVEPIPVEGGGKGADKIFDTLINLINDFNERMGGGLSEGQQNTLTVDVPEILEKKADELQYILNSDKDNAKLAANDLLKKVMFDLMWEHTDLFKKFSNDDAFKRKYEDFIFNYLWTKKQQGLGNDLRK